MLYTQITHRTSQAEAQRSLHSRKIRSNSTNVEALKKQLTLIYKTIKNQHERYNINMTTTTTTTNNNNNNNNGFTPRPKKDTKAGDPKNDNTKKKFTGTTKGLEVIIDGKKGNPGVQMAAFEQGLQKYAGLT